MNRSILVIANCQFPIADFKETAPWQFEQFGLAFQLVRNQASRSPFQSAIGNRQSAMS
jgi:hypothetical protein